MEHDMNILSFNTIREIYKNLRILELYKIKDYLDGYSDDRIKIESIELYQGQQGCDNWLGLDVIINENGTIRADFVSLQTFAQRKYNDNSGNTYINYYTVTDKIGIYKYPSNIVSNHINNGEKLYTIDAYKNMGTTRITLPMDEDKLKDLVSQL